MNHDDIARALAPDLPQLRQMAHHADLARYLEGASLAELAHLVGALAAECAMRGVQVAEPLGLVASRLEYCQEVAAP